MPKKNSTNRRSRNWCAVVYPDSAPENWKEYLNSLNIKWCCSPLHNKDVDDDGVLKKAHWHIVVCFSGNKSFEQICEDITEPLHAPIPQICRDVRSSIRYFVHMDHPHKFQYSQSDIECYGGFDLDSCLKLSSSEKSEVYKDIYLYISENNIVEFFDLVNHCIQNDVWFKCVTENSALFERIVRSNRHRNKINLED